MQIETILADIEACEDQADLEGKLQQFVESKGFASFCFVDAGVPHLDVPYHVSTDMKWTEEYQNQAFVHVDEGLSRARRTNTPFTWGDIKLPVQRGRRKPGAIKAMDAAADHGFQEGLIVPFHFVDELRRMKSALCTVFWRDPPAEFRSIVDRTAHELHFVLIYWMQRSMALREAADPTNVISYRDRSNSAGMQLTDRERDVLSWAARGKTVAVTAEILNISADTVESHVKSAVARLEAGNKTHAVAKALTLGAIDI